MKTKLSVLFWCDANHTHNSRKLAGVFDDLHKAFRAANKDSKNSEEGKLTPDDKFNLMKYKQTQNRGENYLIEERELNQLLE